MFAEKTDIDKGGNTANPGKGAAVATTEAASGMPVVQRKMMVGSVNDPQEREADSMADQVMRMPDQGFVQRKCASSIRSAAGRGSKLDSQTLSFMSSRMPAIQRKPAPGKDPAPMETPIEDPPGHSLEEDMRAWVREPLLEAVHSHDPRLFLNRIDATPEDDAKDLLDDQAFWDEIRAFISGAALWTAFTKLLFRAGPTMVRNLLFRLSQKQLLTALVNRNIGDTMTSVAVILTEDKNILPQAYWEMLGEVVATIFKGDPQMASLFRMVIHHDSPSSAPTEVTYKNDGMHYEPTGRGTFTLETSGRQYTSLVQITLNEFRVVLTILFLDPNHNGKPYTFSGPGETGVPDKWKAAIEATWNNRFELDNGDHHPLKFTVAPRFIYEMGPANATVAIHTSRSDTCRGMNQPGREDEGCWFIDSAPDTVAHEFGHLLGALDEYGLPASTAEIPPDKQAGHNMTELAKYSTMQGIQNSANAPWPQKGGYTVKGLMGEHSVSREVMPRHIHYLIDAFNATLPADKQYKINKR